jgi:addiction module HigA family antidote
MKTKTTKTLPPMHPGEMLREDWLADYSLTPYALAKALKVPQSRLSEILRGKRAITADTALRLSRYFGNSPEFWLNLQSDYDLRMTDAARIQAEVLPRAA